MIYFLTFLSLSFVILFLDPIFLLAVLGEQLPPTQEFASLKGIVSEKTLDAIKEMEFTKMTEIQHRTIMPLLAGR